MKFRRSFLSTLLGGLLAMLAVTGHAENSKDFGQYVVHFNALATDQLPARVAREYRITRSKNRGMINITVLRKVLGSPGQPVHAFVEDVAASGGYYVAVGGDKIYVNPTSIVGSIGVVGGGVPVQLAPGVA